MSAPVDPTVAATGTTATTGTSGGVGTVTGTTGDVSSISTIGSLGALQAQAPAVYKAMMQGIAMNICNAMEQQQAALKALQDEYNREAQG